MMSPSTALRAFPHANRTKRAIALIAGAVSLTLGMTGCGVTNVIKAVHNAVNAAGQLKNIEATIQKGENAKFEATYKSTSSGQAATTFTFAQAPGGKYLYLSAGVEDVANGTDSWTCSQASSGGKWSCQSTPETTGAGAVDAMPFYAFTGADAMVVIESLSVFAALAGFTVKNFSSSVAGVSVQCTSIVGKENGTSYNDEWCVTSDGILGLEKETSSNSSNNESFTLTSLNNSPSSSVFEPPAGSS